MEENLPSKISRIQKAKQMIHKPRLGFMNLTLNTDEFKSKAKWFVNWASNFLIDSLLK